MKQIFRDPDLQAAFERDGFVIVDMLTRDEASAALDQVAALKGADGFEVNQPSHAPAIYVSLSDEDPEIRFAGRSLARNLLADRTGALVEGYRFLTGGVVSKPAGAAPTAVHRDWTMASPPTAVTLNCWCTLVDVSPENGALKLLRGSHRLVGNIEGPRIQRFMHGFADNLFDRMIPIPLQAGQAVIFDYNVVHGSTPNHGATTRAALSISLIPEDARPVIYVGEPPDGGRIRIVEPEDPDWTDVIIDATGRFGSGGGNTVGYIPNRNRMVSQRQLERMLAREAKRGAAPAGLLERLRAWLPTSRAATAPR